MIVIYHAKLKRMSQPEKAYLAGLIDGEGYVGVTRALTSKSAKGCKRGAAYRTMLAVRMTDRGPLDFAARVTGLGKVISARIPKGGKRTPWTWVLWSKQAASVLSAIRPYLLVKGPGADVALEFQAAMRMPGGFGLKDDEWAAREAAWMLSRSLTHGKGAAA